MLSLAHELRERGAELLIVSDDTAAHSLATTLLPMAGMVDEWLSPIPAIVPGQLLALHLTLAKGFDPDHPRGLKKVTRTL
jgi:glucosamine--fructose-6-phosphate aminotransferase (isomerizing)